MDLTEWEVKCRVRCDMDRGYMCVTTPLEMER